MLRSIYWYVLTDQVPLDQPEAALDIYRRWLFQEFFAHSRDHVYD